jgi:hypothetical protein
LDGEKEVTRRARENIGLLEIQEVKILLIKVIIFLPEETTNIS